MTEVAFVIYILLTQSFCRIEFPVSYLKFGFL